jgi:hypothetical protein
MKVDLVTDATYQGELLRQKLESGQGTAAGQGAGEGM